MESWEILDELKAQTDDSFCLSIINGQKMPSNVFATQLALDIIPILYDILEKKGKVEKVSLVLRSNGGILDAPLPIVNLLKEYCDDFNVFIPENAHSAATLIALAGDSIIMSPVASLSPIDPQINMPSQNKEIKVNNVFSVEDIQGYYNLFDKLKITPEGRIRALELMVQKLDPTLLGQIERARELIKIYAERILSGKKLAKAEREKVINKLVEKIPSHNYRISRKEAKEIGLPIEEETPEQHDILKRLLTEYKNKMGENELELLINFADETATVEKNYYRALIETSDETYAFETKYIFHKSGKIDTQINQWKKIR